MQDLKPGPQTPNRQQTECSLTNRLSYRGSSKNLNSTARPYDKRAFSRLDPIVSWISHLALAIYIFVVVNFDALAQASDIQIERRQDVFICWMQNLNPGPQTRNRQQTEYSLTNRLSYRGSSKNLNSTARTYDQRAFIPLDLTVGWLSYLALAIYIFVVVNFDALAQANDIQIGRRQVVFLCWMQDLNPGPQTPNRQQTECSLTNRLSYRGSSKNLNSTARPYDQRAFSPLDPSVSWLSHLALAIYIFVVVNFDALAQASDIQIERRQVVFLCWMQDLNPGPQTPNRQKTECSLTNRLSYRGSSKNLNSTARPYDQRAFSPLDPTVSWLSHLALAICIFVVVNFDALAQASDIQIERRQVVFLCWMQDLNPGPQTPNRQQTECSLINQLSYPGSSKNLNSTARPYDQRAFSPLEPTVSWLSHLALRYTYLFWLISMLWHMQAIFKSKGDKMCSSAECRIWTQGPRHQIASRLNTHWQTDWAIEDQAKTWTRQPVPMISEHSAHLTPLSVDFRTWLCRYTHLLLLISMLWHRQTIFKSKGDKLCSSAECRIWTQGPRHQIASRLNSHWQTDWAIEDQAKTWTRQPVPMISEHSAHLTALSVDFRTWLGRYTHLLLLIAMLWHRQTIFKSKGDKLCSSAECRIWTRGPRYQIASRLNAHWQTDWAIEDQAKTWTRQPVPPISEHSAPLTPLTVDFRTWLWYIFVVVNFDALAQASDIQIERRQVVFLCWMQDLNPGPPTPNRQQTECSLTNRLSYRGSSKNLNSTALPYDQRAFSPLDPTVSWHSHRGLAICIFVVVNFDALAQASDIQIERRQVVFLCWMQDLNPGPQTPNRQQTEYSLANRLSYRGSSKKLNSTARPYDQRAFSPLDPTVSSLSQLALVIYIFVVVNFDALTQASDLQIERRQVVFLCWMQDLNPGPQTPNRQQTECSLTKRLSYRGWNKNLNSTARPYDQRAFSPLDPTVSWLSQLALAIYIFVVVNFDALVQASDLQIERRQVVFLCWMQDLNPGPQTPNRQQTECSLTKRLSYRGSNKNLNSTARPYDQRAFSPLDPTFSWLSHLDLALYIFVVVNFDALAQASDIQIERRQVVFYCWMQDLNPGPQTPNRKQTECSLTNRLSYRGSSKNLNSTASPYDQRAFSPLDPTVSWLSHLALAIYIFVVVNFDALAQASDIQIERRQVVFLCWMQDLNPGPQTPNRQQTECSLTNRLSYRGSSKNLNSTACPYDQRAFSPLDPTVSWLSHLALAIYIFVVVNFDALAQASDIQIERRQVVFLCWMQDLNTGPPTPNRQQTECSLTNRLSYWGSSKNLNSTACPYDQRAFSPLDPTVSWLQHLALAIYIFVVVNFDALAQASDIQIERKQVVLLCCMQNLNMGPQTPNRQQTECSLTNRLSYRGSSKNLNSTASPSDQRAFSPLDPTDSWLSHLARAIYIFVVVNFDALAQASDIQIERRQVVFLCWMQDLNPGPQTPNRQQTECSLTNRLSYRGSSKNLNSTALPCNQQAFSPLDPTDSWLSHLALAIYIFVVNFDALAQASDIQIERRQVVFLCWMQDLNPGPQTPNRQQTECSLTNRLSYRGSSKNLNSTARPYDQRAFSPLDPTVSWLSQLALAIYIFVVVNFDALAQASDIQIERRQVVFLCWMQDLNPGPQTPNRQQAECSLTNRLSYRGSSSKGDKFVPWTRQAQSLWSVSIHPTCPHCQLTFASGSGKRYLKSKGGELCSTAECRIWTRGRRHQIASRLNAHWQNDWAIGIKQKLELDSQSL